MIDFIKLCLHSKDKINEIKNNEHLEFSTFFSEDTGEIRSSEAHHKNLKFKITHNKLIISGSLHKYYNDGKFNYNDFNLLEFIHVIKSLSDKFNLPIDKLWIINLEIGVNILPPIETNEILMNIFHHKGHKFGDISVKKGNYQQCSHQQYDLKVYNKSEQVNLRNELLRFEIKYKKLNPLKKFGIFTLLDLLNPEIIQKLGNDLTNKWEEILFIDPTINKSLLNSKEKEKLYQWENKNYWTKLKKEGKSKNSFNREVIRYKKLVAEKSANMQKEIMNKISKKWGKLTDYTEKDIIYFVGKINHSYIKLIFSDYIRRCPVTKLDISMQGKYSCFLSQRGIEYYKEKYPETYQNLKKEYLPPGWEKRSEKIQMREIAHNIRNKYHNIRRDFRNLMRKDKPKLFDTTPFIENSKFKDYEIPLKAIKYENLVDNTSR